MKQFSLKDGQRLTIRTAKHEDASNLINYVKKIGGESDYLTFGENEFEITVEKEEELLESFLISDNKLYIIAEIDGKIVGSLNFSGGSRQRTKHTGEFGVSVEKKYWGLGIGRELINYLIDWAEEGDVIKKINLRVREDNKRAIGLYEKLGFKKEGVISRGFFVNDEYYSFICMGLEL
ncbi:GNAT family N-acetyltransferase [Paratissierella segnis]|jgi:RimJ/RimL family protein N-acetyltransferase|uniref:GNAT family N-acetyltransferase n=1 Tax=Paratissierella segnis TaxID=2763679 RepID=A0A926EQR3_9FIRM|nr:GNAT family N-acetyltransferase [Paratissierella segnis]MBC8588003.1 GNAT family N-acetyltransferase [Paratissierella segnis]